MTMYLPLQAYSQWLEKAAPFAVLLLLVFLKHHILGESSSPALSSSAQDASPCASGCMYYANAKYAICL